MDEDQLCDFSADCPGGEDEDDALHNCCESAWESTSRVGAGVLRHKLSGFPAQDAELLIVDSRAFCEGKDRYS